MSKLKAESDNEQSSLNSSQLSEDETEQNQHKEKYSAETLMMMLDKQRLRALKKEFKEHQDGIELPNFVWLMKCALNVADEEKADLVLGLYYLFQEIDINGDEHMEWSEFTQYIIDAVMSQQNREKLDNKELSPQDILDVAYSLKHIRFQYTSTPDKNIHTGYIKYLKYFNSLDLVAYFESGCKFLKLVDQNLETKYQILPDLIAEAFIVAAAYSETEALLVLVSSDRKIHRFEKDKDGFRKLDRKGTTPHFAVKPIEGLWYFEKIKSWIAVCKDYTLRRYNMRDVDDIITYKGHDQKIMDVVEIWKPACFASSSMDSNVILWNVSDGSTLGIINTEQIKGVRNMDYINEYGGYLLTVGFEREIKIWNPESNLLKCFVGKLEGHTKAVLCCKFFKGKGICASLDEEGNIRVWDIRQQTCLQIISNEKLSIDVDRLVVLYKHDKFMISGKRLMTFELIHNAASHEKLYEIKPISVEFNSYYMHLVILTRFDIRVYDCITGKLKKVFTKFKGNEEVELSTMSLDRRNRVVIVGDSMGAIRTYNVFNGSHIKNIRDKMDKTTQQTDIIGRDCIDFTEISCFCVCKEDNILVAATWGSSIMFFNTKNISEISLLRHLQGGHAQSDITGLAYSPYLSLLASASSNGIVSIWDFEKGNLERSFFAHQHEISNLIFLDPYPVLLSSSRDGTNCLWDLTQERIQDNPLRYFTFKTNSTVKGKPAKCFITCSFAYQEKTKETGENPEKNWDFYIGDSKGLVRVLNFRQFFSENSIVKIDCLARTKPNFNPFRKDKKNVSSYLAYWKKKGVSNLTGVPFDVDFKALKHEWQAHDDLICCMKYIPDPECIVTCSLDRYLKLWNTLGESWGIINLAIPDLPKKWNFPFKWEKRRKEDIEKVVELLSLIDSDIDFNTELVLPEKKPAAKKQKKKKKSNQGYSYQPEVQKNQYFYESSFEEDPHKEEKKNAVKLFEENDEGVNELKKKLDEIDENIGKGPEKQPKCPVKLKEEEKTRTKKLPVISQKSPKRNSNESQKNPGFKLQVVQPYKSRPMFGSYNHLYTQKVRIQSPCFQPNVIENKDIKFAKGESSRQMNKAISLETLSRSSKVPQLREDYSLNSIQQELKVLQSKYRSHRNL